VARRIYVFCDEREEPEFDDPDAPIARENLETLFSEKLDGMIRYRVLGKHHYTHNNVGLEANLKFEKMPCIRFDLRKTGVEILQNYLHVLRNEFGAITIFNPEGDRVVLSDSEDGELEQFLWPPNTRTSVEI